MGSWALLEARKQGLIYLLSVTCMALGREHWPVRAVSRLELQCWRGHGAWILGILLRLVTVNAFPQLGVVEVMVRSSLLGGCGKS